MEFQKKKEFFIGIDSDGTAFDSMRIKHTLSFIPAAIEVFGIGEYSEEFTRIEEKVNLYSLTRGINRFPGLFMSFEELEKETGFSVGNLGEFDSYIKSGFPFSNKGLEDYLAEHPSEFCEKVLRWSRLSDEYFDKGCEGIEPFSAIVPALEKMQENADIMVVSAASQKGLERDWTQSGIAKNVAFIAGQELGKKKEQLLFAKKAGYDEKKMLMIGDAPGDFEAAQGAGTLFYPIIPRQEEKCWEELRGKYFDMFIRGEYTQEVQNELYDTFKKTLS